MLLPYLPISYVFSFSNGINTISERQSILVYTFSFFSLWPLCSYTFLASIHSFVLTDCDRNVVKATVLDCIRIEILNVLEQIMIPQLAMKRNNSWKLLTQSRNQDNTQKYNNTFLLAICYKKDIMKIFRIQLFVSLISL